MVASIACCASFRLSLGLACVVTACLVLDIALVLSFPPELKCRWDSETRCRENAFLCGSGLCYCRRSFHRLGVPDEIGYCEERIRDFNSVVGVLVALITVIGIGFMIACCISCCLCGSTQAVKPTESRQSTYGSTRNRLTNSMAFTHRGPEALSYENAVSLASQGGGPVYTVRI